MTVIRYKPRPVTQAQLSALVLAYAASGDLPDAAAQAGMREGEAQAALRLPGVRQMMARALRHQIDIIAAPEALACALGIMRDPGAPVRARADMAKTILDRAGAVATTEKAAEDRALAELSRDELSDLVTRLQEQVAERDAAADRIAQEPDWLD